MDAVTAAHDGKAQRIDASIVWVHQLGATATGLEIDVEVVPDAA